MSDTPGREANFLSSIAAARQEAQSLFELSQDLGASLSLGETLSVFSVKLKPMVPYDAIAIYIPRGDELIPEYVNGDNYRLFCFLADSDGRWPLRLGGAEQETDCERKSFGGAGLLKRS